MAKLRPLKDAPLRIQAARTIRRAIFSGRFQPGAQLLEMHLAEDLRVSQTTIREALGQLEQAGLVHRVPNRGTSVTTHSPDELHHRLTIRFLLEGWAWTAAAARMGPREFAQLEELLEDIRSATAAGPQKAEAEFAFHRYIWEQSQNTTLVRMLDLATLPLIAFVVAERRQQPRAGNEVDASHEEILSALRHGGEEALTATLRQHLESSYGSFSRPENLPLGPLIANLADGQDQSSRIDTGELSI